MTAREDVLARIEGAVLELKAHAVKELWLFGSAGREELNAGSDVDILVDFVAPVTLFEFARLRRVWSPCSVAPLIWSRAMR